MFKVIFYKVAYNHNMVGNRLYLGRAIWKTPQERRKYFELDRASCKPLFDCYCINEFQLKKIHKFLQNQVGYKESVYHCYVGYKIIV